MSAVENIVVLGSFYSQVCLPPNFRHIDSIEDLPVDAPCLIVINQKPDEQDVTLNKMHYSRKAYRSKVFVIAESGLSSMLSDGVFNIDSYESEFRAHLNNCERQTFDEYTDPLIAWLGIDKSRRLLPLKNVLNPKVYSYPLIEAIYPDLTSADKYALSLVKQDILENDGLFDRVRACRKCASAHINYVDVCPQCRSIDINEQQSLHCFTCGFVAEEQRFQRHNKLECPNCLSQLRHIGVDYDRPLESLSCNSCSHTFVESETVASCFSCNEKQSTSDLIVRNLYKMKIAFHGEYLLEHGRPINAPELSLQGKVDSNYFINLIDWVNRLALRHKEQHMILALYLPDLDDYAAHYGVSKMFNLLNQITERLNGLFRESDICCQYRNDVLLVFLPKTGSSHLSVIQQKVGSLSQKIEDDSFTLNVFVWELPSEDLEADSTAWFESKLRDIYGVN